jgi:hypothetical protein
MFNSSLTPESFQMAYKENSPRKSEEFPSTRRSSPRTGQRQKDPTGDQDELPTGREGSGPCFPSRRECLAKMRALLSNRSPDLEERS